MCYVADDQQPEVGVRMLRSAAGTETEETKGGKHETVITTPPTGPNGSQAGMLSPCEIGRQLSKRPKSSLV